MALPADPQQIQAFIAAQVQAQVQEQLAAIQAAQPAAEPAHHHDEGPRLKVKVPETFYGNSLKEDVELWLYQVDHWLRAGRVQLEMEKIILATGLLRGAALSWWRSVELAPNPPITWEDFRGRLKEAFQPINPVETARDRLARLRQTTSANAYATIFRNVTLEIPGITDDEKKDRFIRGLKRRTQEEVRLRTPSTFEEAVQLAVRYDSLMRPSNWGGGTARDGSSSHGPAPMELGAITSTNRPSSYRPNGQNPNGRDPNGSSSPNQRTKLTPELRQQLIKEGKCFYCRKPGHRALQCPEKKGTR